MHKWIFDKKRSTQNQSSSWRIDTKEGRKSASCTNYGNRLLLLIFCFTSLDGDLWDFHTYDEGPVQIGRKVILWVEYILNRSGLHHMHSKWNILASRSNILGSTNFGEQINSLSSLIPQPWVGAQHCHPEATWVYSISSLLSGEPLESCIEVRFPLSLLLSLISVSSNPSYIESMLLASGLWDFLWCHDTNTSSAGTSLKV